MSDTEGISMDNISGGIVDSEEYILLRLARHVDCTWPLLNVYGAQAPQAQAQLVYIFVFSTGKPGSVLPYSSSHIWRNTLEVAQSCQ